MSSTDTELFIFSSVALPNKKFYVARFEGTEALNSLFNFKIVLLCDDADIDTESLVGTRGVFTIHRQHGEDAVFSGYIAKITQGARHHNYSYYTVSLRPAFGKFRLIVNSSVFLQNDLKQTIEKIIGQETFFRVEHEFRFSGQYPVKEFAMQYNEKAFDYILYRLEEQGAYFYFDQTGERVVFADDPKSHEASQGTIIYSPHSGLDFTHIEEVVRTFTLDQSMLPAKVVVRNYDWKNPNKIIVGTADVSKNGLGDVYLTNEEVESEEEAKRIAKIRAEQILATSRIFKGTGSVPFLRPGVVFTLKGHHTNKFNRDYLVTKIKHEGKQETLLNLVLAVQISDKEEHVEYRNSFECIESDVKYHSSRTIARASIPGAIHAFIDGDNAKEPIMDKYGRYKVLFPFDISGRTDGKASCWIRRAQEQVGKDCGIAFPLLPGTEVLVTFLDGNPDHPVITGALANEETGSISGGGNSSFSGIRTQGGPQLTFDSKHNGVSLSNLTGSGLKFASGSLDYMQQSTHIGLSSTSVATSEVAGFFKDQLSGFSAAQTARCDKISTYVFGLIKALSTAAEKEISSISSDTSDPDKKNSLDWGASGIKMGVVTLDLVQKLWNSAHSSGTKYNVSISGKKEVANTSVQCFPSKAKVVANIVLLLLSRGISAGTEGGDTTKLSKESDTAGNKDISTFKTMLLKCMQSVCDLKEINNPEKYDGNSVPKGEYYNGALSSPCAYYTKTSSAIAFTLKKLEIKLSKDDISDVNRKSWNKAKAELTALSLQLDSLYSEACEGTQSKKEYNEFVKKKAVRNTVTSQITSFLPELAVLITTIMWAKKLHKANIGGIMIDAQDKNLNLHANSYIGQHAERGIYMNTVKAKIDYCEEWGSPSIKVPGTADPNITEIFKKIDSEMLANGSSTVEDFIKGGHVNTKEAGWGNKAKVPDSEDTFIAGQTHLYYMQSLDSFQYTENKWVSIAETHTIKSSVNKPQATISVYSRGYIQLKSTGAINLSSQDDQGNHVVVTVTPTTLGCNLYPVPEKGKFHGLSANAQMVGLMQCKTGEPSSLSLLDGEAKLTACPGGNSEASLALKNNKAELSAKEVIVAGYSFSGNKIQGAKGGVLLFGNNSVKVTNVAEIEQTGKEIAEKAKKAYKELMSKFSEIYKKMTKEIVKADGQG